MLYMHLYTSRTQKGSHYKHIRKEPFRLKTQQKWSQVVRNSRISWERMFPHPLDIHALVRIKNTWAKRSQYKHIRKRNLFVWKCTRNDVRLLQFQKSPGGVPRPPSLLCACSTCLLTPFPPLHFGKSQFPPFLYAALSITLKTSNWGIIVIVGFQKQPVQEEEQQQKQEIHDEEQRHPQQQVCRPCSLSLSTTFACKFQVRPCGWIF